MLTLRKCGVNIPLEVNKMGRYILIAVDFGRGPSGRVRGPAVPASYLNGPAQTDGPIYFMADSTSLAENGPNQFDPPRTFSAC